MPEEWLRERRPDLQVDILDQVISVPPSRRAGDRQRRRPQADIGICAADNEQAKLHSDALMRRHEKPWTLGEVLSGGIGGFVHWFVPGGPCYGCVASHLQRSVAVDKPKAPDYSQPGGPATEVTVPASKASIGVIAALHALVTLQLLADPRGYQPGFTSLLFTLDRVPEVFDEMYRPFRFRIERCAGLFVVRCPATPLPPEDLDAALDDALERINQ